MPRIEVSRRDLLSLAGCPGMSGEALETVLASLKAELKAAGDVLKIELNDTNRPDLWCVEGVARGMAGLAGASRRYLRGLPPAAVTVEVRAGLERVRPWIAAFAAKGPAVTAEFLEALIAAQEKLCSSFGRERRTAATGFYRLEAIRFPVSYCAAEPGSVRFVPLEETAPMSTDEILERTEAGRRYASILSGSPVHPVLTDASGQVLSFPPVINSEGTGRVVEGDTGLFCEVTGTDWNTVQLTSAILACNLEDRGWSIEPATVSYPSPSPLGREVLTPHRFRDELSVSFAEVGRVLGLTPSPGEIVQSLDRMGWEDIEACSDTVRAAMPPYRHDGMHPVDMVEDIAIGYGLDRFEPLMPTEYTVGGSSPAEALAGAVRDVLVGAGCEEVLLPVLTSADSPGAPPGIVTIENPMTSEYGAVRNSLLPGLLSVEAASAHAAYPHRIFETGDVLAGSDSGPVTTLLLAAAVFGNEASFGDAHSLAGLLASARGVPLGLEPHEDGRFIPGRCARVLLDGRDSGILGEVHPALLERYGITRPGSAFELRLDLLLGPL